MAAFLRSSDAFVWTIEADPRQRSTIVTLTLLDRSPDWESLVGRFDLLSREVPVFRQRVLPSPLFAPPRWQVDSDFDLAFHVRKVLAPRPGDFDAVLEMARVAAMADFDRSRPLWEATLIEGLADGGAALLCKLNHAVTDGIGAVEMAKVLFDQEAHQDEQGAARTAPNEQPAPRSESLVRDVASYASRFVLDTIANSLSSIPALTATAIRHPVDTVTNAASTAASIARTGRPIFRPASPIMRRRSKARRLATYAVPTRSLRTAAGIAGGSLNDAFIAAVAGGLRLYHEKHAVELDNLVVMMPINIRTSTDDMGGNRATLMRFGVPAAIVDPGQRIRAVRERTTRARNEKSLDYTDVLAAGLNLAPRWYVSTMLRNVDVIASDVPGIPIPVFLAGAAVTGLYAFAPTLGAGANVTLLSYVDTCGIGMNADTAAIPDYDAFFECITAGFDEVLALTC